MLITVPVLLPQKRVCVDVILTPIGHPMYVCVTCLSNGSDKLSESGGGDWLGSMQARGYR